jgi:hypothetical protein
MALPAPYNSRFPARRLPRQLGKSLDRMEAQAIADRRADQLAIERAVEATEFGMVGIAKISLREAAVMRAVPHAEQRLRSAADSGSAVVLGRIFEAGL